MLSVESTSSACYGYAFCSWLPSMSHCLAHQPTRIIRREEHDNVFSSTPTWSTALSDRNLADKLESDVMELACKYADSLRFIGMWMTAIYHVVCSDAITPRIRDLVLFGDRLIPSDWSTRFDVPQLFSGECFETIEKLRLTVATQRRQLDQQTSLINTLQQAPPCQALIQPSPLAAAGYQVQYKALSSWLVGRQNCPMPTRGCISTGPSHASTCPTATFPAASSLQRNNVHQASVWHECQT